MKKLRGCLFITTIFIFSALPLLQAQDSPVALAPKKAFIMEFEQTIKEIYKKNSPAIVRISSCPETEDKNGSCSKIGTGFIIRPDGYILTTADLICNADSIEVIFSDDWKYMAKLIAMDMKLNIALIKIAKKGLPVVTIGVSDGIVPGMFVLNIANPYGLANSLAIGYISGRYRSGFMTGQVENYLQTTIPLNPGDSGSPLFNCRGEVIGIMSAVLVDDMNSSTNEPQLFQPSGISFAIPIDIIKDNIPDMIKEGRLPRCWVGFEVQSLMREDFIRAGIYKAEDQHGILITKIFPDSPAIRAGLKAGDIIQKVDQRDVLHLSDLQMYIIKTGVDKIIEFTIIRGNMRFNVPVQTEEMPDFILNKKM